MKDTDIPYTVKTRKGSRSIRIAVYPDGSVIVTKPKSASDTAVARLVEERREWIITTQQKLAHRPQKLLAHYSSKDFKEHKERARTLVHERIAHFNSIYNYPFASIAIRNQKTRWGSCSRRRNLNFNYKLVFLPRELADYVIVHELCHLKEMNHGPQFWALVAQTIPDYKEKRMLLRKY